MQTSYAVRQKWDGNHHFIKGGFPTIAEANDYINAQLEKGSLPQPQGEDREYYILPDEPLQVKVGDIYEHTSIYYSIYYSTRTTFVKVVGVSKSGKTCDVIQLGKEQVDGDWMNGNVRCSGRETNTYGTKFRLVRAYDGGVGIRGRLRLDFDNGHQNVYSIHTYRKWDGKPIWNNCD